MHPYMAMPIEECVDKTHLKEKITAIIPTANASMEFLLWSVFSLLLRSRPGGLLEHVCVCINGPDERTGKTELQDQKQRFLEELRDMEWYHTDNPSIRSSMPLTVIRAWSRVGYAEAFEMALGWIHTDSYLLMHDDVIIINHDWLKEVKEKFYGNSQVAIVYTPPLLGCNCDHAIHRGMYLLRFPQMETTFLLAKKRWIMAAKATWTGYHIPADDCYLQLEFDENGTYDPTEPEIISHNSKDELIKYYQNKGLMEKPIQTSEQYNFVRQGIGSWIYYRLCQLNVKFVELEKQNIIHFQQMSNPVANKQECIAANSEYIGKLEEEILTHPVYAELYRKYMPKEEIKNA